MNEPQNSASCLPDQIERSLTMTSMLSGKQRTRTFRATAEQWALLDKGVLIQNALPHLSNGDREFLMTGVTDEEWDEAFPEEDKDLKGTPGRGSKPAF